MNDCFEAHILREQIEKKEPDPSCLMIDFPGGVAVRGDGIEAVLARKKTTALRGENYAFLAAVFAEPGDEEVGRN